MDRSITYLQKRTHPDGKHWKEKFQWDGGTQVSYVRDPVAGYVDFIHEIHFFVPTTLAFDAGKSLEIVGIEGAGVEKIIISSFKELVKHCGREIASIADLGGDEYHHYALVFYPPVMLKDSNASAVFTIQASAAGLITAGEIEAEVEGWSILETDLGF